MFLQLDDVFFTVLVVCPNRTLYITVECNQKLKKLPTDTLLLNEMTAKATGEKQGANMPKHK